MKEPEPEDLLPDIDWRNSSYYEDFKDFIHYEDDTPGIIAMLYLSYMPLCCFVGLTGNTMVWVLIRYGIWIQDEMQWVLDLSSKMTTVVGANETTMC